MRRTLIAQAAAAFMLPFTARAGKVSVEVGSRYMQPRDVFNTSRQSISYALMAIGYPSPESSRHLSEEGMYPSFGCSW